MAADPSVIRLLHEAGMRRTGPRQAVLEFIVDREAAVSHQDLETHLAGRVDRVTIYRILSALEEKGIVHRILDPEGQPLYALCSVDCGAHAHHDEHVHFHCRGCGNTYCLEEVAVPALRLPRGFRLDGLEISVQGLCPRCRGAA